MEISIPVSPRRCAATLGLIVMALVGASLGASFLSIVPIQDPFLREVRESAVRLAWVDGEGNIPSWFSACLFLLGSFLLAIIALAQRQHRDHQVGRWWVLSFIFICLSLDETAQLHELSIPPLRDAFHATGFLYYAWIVPAAICVVLFILAYLSFLARLPARTRGLFLLAGALFVGGALGVEAVSGKHAYLHGEQNLTYHLIVTVEELLEMTGLVVFTYALLDYISRQFPKVGFHVGRR